MTSAPTRCWRSPPATTSSRALMARAGRSLSISGFRRAPWFPVRMASMPERCLMVCCLCKGPDTRKSGEEVGRSRELPLEREAAGKTARRFVLVRGANFQLALPQSFFHFRDPIRTLQYFARLRSIRRSDNAFPLHQIDEVRGASITDAETPLQKGSTGL